MLLLFLLLLMLYSFVLSHTNEAHWEKKPKAVVVANHLESKFSSHRQISSVPSSLCKQYCFLFLILYMNTRKPLTYTRSAK